MSLLGACLAGTWLAAPGAAGAQQAGSAGSAAPLNTLTPDQRAAGWRLLFDRKTTTGAGASSAREPATAGVVKPPGQWNQVRLVVNGNHVEHWLNGVKVVQYELGSPDWEAKVKASKFAPHPRYGRNAEGYIGLQEHEDPVAFRKIKIRVLP